MKRTILFLSLFVWLHCSWAQEDVKYQQPSKEIMGLVDAKPAPSIRIDRKGEVIVMLERRNFKSIQELSQPELRLGGLRINPITNIGSRTRYYYGLSMMKVGEKQPVKIAGLPAKPLLANFNWSPDQNHMAFTHTTEKGVELWVLDIKKKSASKLTDAVLNGNMRAPYSWFKDSRSLLVKFLPSDRKPLIDKSEVVPTGPRVSVNDGKKAQNRTYQDLLKDKADEFNFEQLSRSELKVVDLSGKQSLWMKNDMYKSTSFSPDGNYIKVVTIARPFSYLVPYYRFPSKTVIYDKTGKKVKTMLEVPLIEDLPKGFMACRTGKRDLSWRSDKPATIIWAEALDGGDPEKKVEYRDVVYQLEAPFNGEKQELLRVKNRFSYISWGDDKTAIAYDYWWNNRNTKTYLFNPSNNKQKVDVLFDRNYQDRYSDPGNFATHRNKFNERVLDIQGGKTYLVGDGHTKEGPRPFVDLYNLKTKKAKRLIQAENKEKKESYLTMFDSKKGLLLTRIESKNEYPNYFFRNIKKKNSLKQITFTENPFKAISNVHKEVLKYKREDGLDLSGTLYLPTDYEKGKKYPMIMWAYPREFKDKKSASQVTASSNSFTYPWYGSPIYWVTKGYVVLDNASFPIVGEGEEEPNDSFRSQLVANAKAGIDAVAKLGYIDRNKVAVGGHSYGAFMTANLLSHSNLFAAGIARSGAYNRTLTPFGFQSEERNYWEAPEIYYNMSPFMHAEKMKTPLLLIHGEADNNSGTYPMQSERYFNALKGLGATVRLVMLPKESHGYRARESVLHMLWEQDAWLEKYVKNRKLDNTKAK